jgi:hypothetical protein
LLCKWNMEILSCFLVDRDQEALYLHNIHTKLASVKEGKPSNKRTKRSVYVLLNCEYYCGEFVDRNLYELVVNFGIYIFFLYFFNFYHYIIRKNSRVEC